MRSSTCENKSAADYIAEIKRLVDEFERKFGRVPQESRPSPYQPRRLPGTPPYRPASPYEPRQRGIGFHDYDSEEKCNFREFMKNNPDHTGPLFLSCRCSRCAVRC